MGPTVKAISPDALLDRYRAEPDLLIVDVRNEDEWSERHIPGAKSVPMYRLIARRGEFDPTRETILLCQHGVRSFSVALVLVGRLGFTDVSFLTEGMSAWNGPVSTGL